MLVVCSHMLCNVIIQIRVSMSGVPLIALFGGVTSDEGNCKQFTIVTTLILIKDTTSQSNIFIGSGGYKHAFNMII